MPTRVSRLLRPDTQPVNPWKHPTRGHDEDIEAYLARSTRAPHLFWGVDLKQLNYPQYKSLTFYERLVVWDSREYFLSSCFLV